MDIYFVGWDPEKVCLLFLSDCIHWAARLCEKKKTVFILRLGLGWFLKQKASLLDLSRFNWVQKWRLRPIYLLWIQFDAQLALIHR
jgi:hypothetical protein